MLVLAKALNQKFAHQAGYALINGRWKKTTPDMKGVKNAPKAAHPKAGGKGHKPYAMPQEESSQLLYPAEKEATNKDIKHFNQKHVPNLLQHAANGDIAAILGSSYGVNTHGKKLVAIANYLLEQMGSQEKVSAGQKAGEHPAIATYEREPETVDQMAEQAVEAVAQEAKAATKPATGNLTAKQQAIVSGIESYLGLPPIEAYKVKNNVITIEIGDLKQHQLHAIENYGTQFGYFKTEPGGAKKLSLIMPKDGSSPSPEKKNAAKEEVQKTSTPAAEAPKPGEIVMPKFESGKNSTGVRTAYEALAQYASMMLMANGIKVKSGYNPEVNGTYAMNGVGQLMKATAATSNPAENGLAADGPMEVKKYQWKKKEPISVDEWEVTGGNQGGSNDGMKMKDADGQEWYVKFPDNEEHAKAEVLAAKLYSAAGLSAQDAMIVTKDGKMAIASKWENIKKAKTHAALAKAKGMLEGFAVDAWLGNWDVVGLAKDNVQLKDDGTIHRVDAGGSLMFRAQGAKKEFGPVVKELESLMDPKMNANSAAVFGGMTEADIAASVSKVLAISDAKIAHMVNQYGPGDEKAKKELVETLIKRKEYLAEKYPEAEQIIKMQKFKPEKISTPPDFLNWSGVGKSGPSSKEFLNKGNHDAAQAIYSAALTGDPEAIRGLTAPTFDKDTGAVTGQVPVLDHPSQHIKGYAMQAINEIKSQLTGHEAEQFRIGGDHPLYSMHEEYKPENWSGNDADKIGNLLVLGHPGIVEPEDLGITKTTFKAGTLTTNTYAKAAQEVWEKLPMTQKQAVQAYTGSSYKQMNSGLWKGNPSAEAKAAAQALSGMGHEISPGTTFGRKFSLGSGDLSKLKASVGKVIMEPAIMSTSISPDVWSGNIHLKMTAGPGVKGIYAGAGSLPSGGSISHHTGEKEIILPPNTRLLITKVNESGTKDADGFGGSGMTVVECIILPSV